MAKMIGFYMAVSIIKNKYIKISSVKPYNPVFIEVVYVGNVNGYLKTDIYITSAADGIVYVFTSKKDAYGDLDGGLNLYRKGNDLYLLIGDGITGMKDGGLYIRGTEISTDVIDSVDGLTFVKNICKWLLLGELIGTATGNKSGLMSVEDKKRLGRRFFKGYTKLVESKYWYNHYVALIFGASPASNLGSLIAIDWKGDEPISVTRFLGNNDNVKLYLGRNPETNMHELWLGLIGLDGDGSEFIIQSRESIDLDSKTVETLPSYLKVIPISWQKNNDFSELGELLQNAYDSYSLKESIETEIGVGLGVYYITQPNLASLSCIVIINYDNYQVLGMKGNLSFSVSLLKLTVVSKVGDIDINVRKILKQ